MSYLINFIDFCEYMLLLNWMPATHFKKGETGQQKTGKAQKTPVWNIPHVNRLQVDN